MRKLLFQQGLDTNKVIRTIENLKQSKEALDFYVNKANVIGDTLVTISEQNILNYYDASNLVAVVNDFLQKTTAPFVAPNNLSKEA